MVSILPAFWCRRMRGLWKLLHGRDWLWENLGLALLGMAMLGKSLIQFSVDGWGCFLPVVLCEAGVGVIAIIAPPSKGLMLGLLYSVPLAPGQASVDPCLCSRFLDTHRQDWLSFLWCHCSFLMDLGAHRVLFVPSRSLFPQSCGSSVIKSHCISKSNSLGLLSPFAGSSRLGNLLWALEQCNSARTSLV